MKTFALVVLVIIMITLQHLLNWLWRLAVKDNSDEIIFTTIIGTMVIFVITIICGYAFLEWY